MVNDYDNRLKTAQKIIENLKKEILQLLTETEIQQYCSSRLSFSCQDRGSLLNTLLEPGESA
jgi:hypothetical protein